MFGKVMLFAGICCGALNAQAPVLWEFPNFSDRVQLQVTNPRDVAYDGVAVVKLAELKRLDAKIPGTLLLLARQDRQAEAVPLQISGEDLSFEVHLLPHATGNFYAYYSTTLHDTLPVVARVHASHNYGYNHATAALESDLIGYRTYGGFFLDVEAHARGMQGLFNAVLGYSSISHPPVEGRDVIHLGETLGLGGLFLRAGGKVYQPPLSTPDYTHRMPARGEPVYKVLMDGPLRAAMEESVADWPIGEDHVALRAVYEIDAGQEVVHCHWWLTPIKLSKSYEVGAGIRHLPQGRASDGPHVVTTDGVQEASVGRIALGLGYEDDAARTPAVATKDGANEAVIFRQQLAAGHPVEGSYTVAAAWQGSGWSDPAAHVRQVLQAQSAAAEVRIGAHEAQFDEKVLNGEPK